MKSLLTTQIYVEKQNIAIGTITGKVTKKGVITGATKSGTEYARVSLALGSTDYDVKNAEYVLGLKDKHIQRGGDKADTRPLIFVDVVAFGRNAEYLKKNIQAGDTLRAIGTLSASEYNGNISISLNATAFDKDFFAKNDEASASSQEMTGGEPEEELPFDLATDDLPF